MTAEVKRGPFSITVTDNGELDSVQNITLSSKVEQQTTILSIVPEGTIVRAPVLSSVDGRVTAVRQTGEKERIVTVHAGPAGVYAPYLFLYLEPLISVDYAVTLGPHSAVTVSLGDRVASGQYLAADVVCELDSATYREQAKQQEIVLAGALAALEQAAEALEIQRAQNESDIAAAELNVELAALDLQKFTEGDFLQQQNEIKGEITLAREDLTRYQELYEFSKRLAKKGYRSQNDLEADRIAVTKAEISLKVAEEKLNVLEEFTRKRTVAELSANAQEMVRELERVRRKADAAITQFRADYEARKLTAEVERDKYERLVQQIAACTLLAPQEGQVVYAKPNRRSRDPFTIEEGATVRERQEIVKLPDLTQMKVEAGVHESRISLVGVGQPVNIRVDAFHDDVFRGVVDSVSSVPTPGRWPNYDLKEYPTSIRLIDSAEKINKLKPGLTAQVEILVKRRSDVLQVPVQAVVTVGEDRFVFVLTEDGPERRKLLIGESSNTAVEVLDGTKEGERVVMNPRTHFAEELKELEDAHKADSKHGEEAEDAATPENIAPNERGGNAKTKAKTGGGGSARPSAAERFNRLDKDGDGKLSAQEIPPQMQAAVSELDEDGDGSINRAEFGNATRARPGGPR